MRIVRFACGLTGLVFAWCTIDAAINVVHDLWMMWFPVCLALATVDLLSVALRGKSLYLRFMLSGVNREQAELDDRDDTK